MKKINIYWLLLIAFPALMILSGCNKFLDRKPLTATLDDLEGGSLAGQALNLYYNLRTLAGFSLLPWIDFHSIRGDDAAKGSDINDGKEIIVEFETYQYSKDDWAPNTYWNDHYAMISLTNNLLYEADSLNVSDPGSLRNVGEACFFRAYAYFELVKTYGDVPLINFKIVNPTDGIKDKSPAAEIYAFIDSNLQVAVQYLPPDAVEYGNAGYRGRVTRGSANTLWAQTQLFRQNWSGVIGLCNQVIASGKYSLMPEFSDIWRDGLNGAGKNGTESIFEMNADIGENAVNNGAAYNGSNWGTSQQIRRNGASEEWNLGWGWNQPTESLVNSWPDDDLRKAKTILYSGQFDGGPALGGHGATIPAFSDSSGSSGLALRYWNKTVYR